MGIFDFLSKGTASSPASSSPLQSSPTSSSGVGSGYIPSQSYSNTTSPTPTSFSDLSYPIPSAQVPQAYNASGVTAQNITNTSTTATPTANPVPPVDTSGLQFQDAQDPQPVTPPPSPLDNADQGLQFTSDPNAMADTKIEADINSENPNALESSTPDGLRMVTYESPTASAPLQQTPTESQSQAGVPSAPEVINEQPVTPVNNAPIQDTSSATPVNNLSMPHPVESNDVSTMAGDLNPITQPTLETPTQPIDATTSAAIVPSIPGQAENSTDLTAEVAAKLETTPESTSPENIDTSNVEKKPEDLMDDTVEIGVSAPTEEVKSALEVLETTTPEVTPVSVETPPPVEIQPTESEVATPPITEPQAVTDVQPELNTGAVVVQPEQNKIEDVKEDIDDGKMKVFRSVAFVGLNSPSLNAGVSTKVRSLVTSLADHIDTLLIDSNKGYGVDIIGSVKDKNELSIEGVYFKPFYTNFSDEAELSIDLHDYKSIMFSNIFDKIKYIIKNSQLFIVPETFGVNNLSEFFTLWSSQYLYKKQAKPIILLGSAWKAKIDELSKIISASSLEREVLHFANDDKEAFDLIMKLDAEYSQKVSPKIKQVIDLREEEDEKELFL